MGGKRETPNWTQEEVDYLATSWGSVSYEHMAKILNRSVSAVCQKASKLGLGRFTDHGDYVTLNRLYNAFCCRNFNSYNMKSWIEDRGMPVHMKKRSNRSRVRVVYLEEFWEWAEKNRSFLDFSRMPENALGMEPDWVREQRSKDYRKHLDHRRAPWTPIEDQRLRGLLQQHRYTWPELSVELNRSEGAIQRRCNDLGIRDRPLRSPPHAGSWTPENIEILKHGILNGDPYHMIARKIGKSEKAVRGFVGRTWKTEVADRVRQMIKEASNEQFTAATEA